MHITSVTLPPEGSEDFSEPSAFIFFVDPRLSGLEHGNRWKAGEKYGTHADFEDVLPYLCIHLPKSWFWGEMSGLDPPCIEVSFSCRLPVGVVLIKACFITIHHSCTLNIWWCHFDSPLSVSTVRLIHTNHWLFYTRFPFGVIHTHTIQAWFSHPLVFRIIGVVY